MRVELSQRQQQTIAAAVTIVAAVVIICAVGGILWLIGAFVSRFSNVFLPLAVAGVAALLLHPYYGWMRAKLRIPAPLAVLCVLLSLVVPLGLFGWMFGAVVVEQVSDLISHFPEWWNQVVPFVDKHLPRVKEFIEKHQIVERIRQAVEGIEPSLVQGLQSVGGHALSAGAGVLRGIGTIFAWAVMPVYFVFFLVAEPRKFRDLERYLPFLKPETRRDLVYLFGQFLDILIAFFRGQLIIALIQGVLYAIGFSAVGLRYGLVIGLVLGFLNVIPYLGSIVGLSIALPLAFFQPGGGLGLVALVLAVFVVVQLIESYVLTPKVMGERTGLHPMAIIVAVFFWGSALGGISGLLLAIPLTAFLVVLWRLARERYIGELV